MKALSPRQSADMAIGFGVAIIVKGALGRWTTADVSLMAAGAVLLLGGIAWRARLRGRL